MKAKALVERLSTLTAEKGQDMEVRLMVDSGDGTCLGACELQDIWCGEDVAGTQLWIMLSGTEGTTTAEAGNTEASPCPNCGRESNAPQKDGRIYCFSCGQDYRQGEAWP